MASIISILLHLTGRTRPEGYDFENDCYRFENAGIMRVFVLLRINALCEVTFL